MVVREDRVENFGFDDRQLNTLGMCKQAGPRTGFTPPFPMDRRYGRLDLDVTHCHFSGYKRLRPYPTEKRLDSQETL